MISKVGANQSDVDDGSAPTSLPLFVVQTSPVFHSVAEITRQGVDLKMHEGHARWRLSPLHAFKSYLEPHASKVARHGNEKDTTTVCCRVEHVTYFIGRHPRTVFLLAVTYTRASQLQTSQIAHRHLL
jgi:hypothetical protein